MNKDKKIIKKTIEEIFDDNVLLKDEKAREKQELINNLLKEIKEEEQKNGNR